jgi:hypothetical protein
MSDGAEGTWRMADAWILAAIATTAHPCTLASLVATADGINHSIVLGAEIEHAVRHLVASDLITVSADLRFTLTAKGAALAARRRGGLFGQVDSLFDLLRRSPTARPVDWHLPEGVLDAAVSDYMHRMTAH